MNNEPLSGKRIVGKSAYVGTISAKIALRVFGAASCLLPVYFGWNLVRLFFARPEGIPFFPTVFMLLIPALCLAGGLFNGMRAIKIARQIDAGVFLTHVNTADLPAPDSLVRASSQPTQAQETVLLRASKETQEKHEEQLLRATAGGQQNNDANSRTDRA